MGVGAHSGGSGHRVAEPCVCGEADCPQPLACPLNANASSASALSSFRKPGSLEETARPLLLLARQISGMETSFATSVNHEKKTQETRVASNTGELHLDQQTVAGWQDSMCRSLLNAGLVSSSRAGVPALVTEVAKALGIKSFFAVPVMMGGTLVGTVCGASQDIIGLSDLQLSGLQLVATALQKLLEAEAEKVGAQDRAFRAEAQVKLARMEARRHAGDSQRMQYLANTDEMTGLPNRRAFIARWKDQLLGSELTGYRLGLIMIDADRFKAVNDGMGHEKGDAVLRAIAATLMVVKQSSDVIARLGGDEFAFSTIHGHSQQLLSVADEVRRLFKVMAAELGVTTTLSMGMVSSDDCHRSQMLATADKALYLSKSMGGNIERSLPPAMGGFSHAA